MSNPFEPPADLLPAATAAPTPGLWTDGDVVIQELGAQFPGRCILCNHPAHRRTSRVVSWRPPATANIYLLAILGILPLILVLAARTRTRTVTFALCDTHHARQQAGLMILGGAGLLAVGATIGAVMLEIPALLWVAIGAAVGAWAAWSMRGRLVWAQRIEGTVVEIAGASPVFLATLAPAPPALMPQVSEDDL